MGLLSGSGVAAYKSVDRTNFTATAGQTTFTLAQGYAVGDVDVFLNGVKLLEGDDYFASTGTTVVLNSPAVAGDFIQVVSYNQFNVSNTYTKSEADSRYMVATGQTPMQSYLRTPNYGVSSWSDADSVSLEASQGAGTQGVSVKAWGRSMATYGGDVHYIADTRGASGSHRFYGWNGTTWSENMKVDTLGRVIKANQPAFSSYCMTNETTAIGAAAPFTAVRYNIGGHFNTSTRRFTAPVAGRYLFTHGTNCNGIASGSGMYFGFYVNGNRVSGWFYTTSNGNWMLMAGSVVLNLNAGDYVFVAPGVAMHWDYGSDAWGNFDGYFLG